jgi:hypothetical protein
LNDPEQTRLLIRSASTSATPEAFLSDLVSAARGATPGSVVFSSLAQTVLWIFSTRVVSDVVPEDILINLAVSTDSDQVTARLREFAADRGLLGLVRACVMTGPAM